MLRSTLTGACALALLLSLPSNAASITWGPSQNVVADTDVSTAGSLVGAFNLGGNGVASITVNGVPFTGLALSGTSVSSGNFNFTTATGFVSGNGIGVPVAPFNALSPAYQTLLDSADAVFPSPNSPNILTISNLVIGQSYQFQWWASTANAFAGQTTATAGNSVTLFSNPTNTVGFAGVYVIGDFTADATSQLIDFSTTAPHSGPLNAFQLRALPTGAAVPLPPGAWGALITLAPLALFAAKSAERHYPAANRARHPLRAPADVTAPAPRSR